MPLSRLLRMVLAFAIGLLFLLVLIVLLYLTQSAFEVWTHLKETPGWFLVGQVVEQYLAQGKSWGEGGPKQVVREILDGAGPELHPSPGTLGYHRADAFGVGAGPFL